MILHAPLWLSCEPPRLRWRGLTAEGTCQERDREIALNLIAEIAKGTLVENHNSIISICQVQ